MPKYDVFCKKCKKEWEVELPITHEGKIKCTTKWCRGPVEKLIGSTSFVLKGKWFKTGGY